MPDDRTNLWSEFEMPELAEWRAEVERLLKGAPFDRKMRGTTHEGLNLEPLYTAADTAGLPRAPEAPPQRSTWHIVEEPASPDPAVFNTELRRSLERGLDAVMLPFGGPGQSGLRIKSAEDLATALNGVDLKKVPVHIFARGNGVARLDWLLKLAAEQDCPPGDLRGSFCLDPLHDLAALGGSLADADWNDLAELTRHVSVLAPGLATIRVCTRPYAEAGANAVQQLACATTTGVHYLRELESRGVAPEQAAAHMRFGFPVGSDFFTELAKLRAARLVWRRVLAACGLPEEQCGMRIQARTLGYNKTRLDAHNNILRATTEVFAAVAGGADTICVSPFDVGARPPSALACRVARNIQILMREEAHLDAVADPGGGSWYIEKLTADLAESAWVLFQEIEANGGMGEALKSGFLHGHIADSAERKRRSATVGQTTIVGVNHFPAPPAEPVSRQASDTKSPPSLADAAAEPGSAKLPENAARISDGAGTPPPKGAAPANATKSAGENTGSAPGSDILPFHPLRLAEPFERLRAAVEQRRMASGAAMAVYLVTLGPVGRYMPRLDFITSFFAAGGFELIRPDGRGTAESTPETKAETMPDTIAKTAVEATLSEEFGAAVLVGLDETWQDIAPRAAAGLKSARPGLPIYLAGRPADEETRSRLKEAGVRDFVHLRSDMLNLLGALAAELAVELS